MTARFIYFLSQFEATLGLSVMGLVILNLGQVTKTTPELHFLSKLPLQTNMRALSHERFNVQQPLYMAGPQRN
ncbi:hypothetical protein TNCV_1704231 [Trichonephila clavipes]|nr:hypothetical protein TNCV_1704231 [Trichonephila clavipes]